MVKLYLGLTGIIIVATDLFFFFDRDSAYTQFGLHIGFYGALLILLSILSYWSNDTYFTSAVDRLRGHKYSLPLVFVGLFVLSFDLLTRYSSDKISEIGRLDGLTVMMLGDSILLVSQIFYFMEEYLFIHRHRTRVDENYVPPDVFISFSSKDVKLAETLHNVVGMNNLKSWISTKNIDPGQQYATQIIRGIDDAPFFVILVNRKSTASRHVLTELERAFSHSSTIIPVKLDSSEIPKGWEYYLSTSQWMDAESTTTKEWMEDVIALIKETKQTS